MHRSLDPAPDAVRYHRPHWDRRHRDVPAEVAAGITSYLEASNLTYGAFDFVVNPCGDWAFLECNAAGQWGWLAEECELPIAAALADELTAGDTP